MDPDFEYPHHRQVLNQLKDRLEKWTGTDEEKFTPRFVKDDLQEIVEDLESQVSYYEANKERIQLPDLSSLVEIPLEEDVYLLFYHYKLMRQKIVHKRLSASELIKELISNYEKSSQIDQK